MGMFDSFTSSFDNAVTPKPQLDFRKELVVTKFKNIEFKTINSSSAFGRRVVVHERPQQDIPFVEDLGEKNKEITLKAFVIGDNWESQRNYLIDAFRSGPGYLVHPELGRIWCICSICHVDEDKLTQFMRTDFDLTFIEVPKEGNVTHFIDSAEKVRANAKTNISRLQQLMGTIAWIQNLPSQVMDFVSSQLTSLMGFSPYELMGVVSAFNNLKNADFTLPGPLAANIAEFTGAFTFDFTDPAGTNTITPRIAMEQCIANANKSLSYPTETTNTLTTQNNACRYMEQFFVQTSIIHAAVCSTYISYSSYDDAQVVWNTITDLFDQQILAAGDAGNNEVYRILRDCKSDFVEDIKIRAPGLNKIKHVKIGQITPALVIAYEQYDDIFREQEIIDRNKIIHPGFVISDNLEVLVQ